MRDLNPVDNYLHGSWEALGNGAPLLVALAQLCSDSWTKSANREYDLDELSLQAKAILFAARDRGVIEVRAVNSAFEASARLLAVYVEVCEERTIAFRDPTNPAVTLYFLEGFRMLCERGMIIHHIHRDFTLAPQALELAHSISRDDVKEQLDQATEFGLHD